MKIVPDTSTIIDGYLTRYMEDEIIGSHILISKAVIAELEHQANKGREIGLDGLDELRQLQQLNSDGLITLSFVGERPTFDEIQGAKSGVIDAAIRDIALNENATLITRDKIQSEVAKAQGVTVKYIKPEEDEYEELEISKFFDEVTMSVHLKENVPPLAKKGRPGNVQLVKLSERPLSYNEVETYIREIVEKAHTDYKSFIEIEMDGATVIQFREYRISITRPPFSEALELTAVKPVVKVDLDYYNLSEELLERLTNAAKGVLISGAPGAGKSTFAQAIADYLNDEKKMIVKTMESPRDLQVGKEITQYAPLEGKMQNTADILLLVRPDYTLFDEVRKTEDFEIFADMRLAGVGMIGVVHATKPIDAIQRVIARLELGVIPSVIDTTVFIENGLIKAVYEIDLTVKVPTGMQESDLARPVIQVKDFITGEVFNEIYTYGEQTIIMDVSKSKQDKTTSSINKIAEKQILQEVKRIVPKAAASVEILSANNVNLYVDERFTAQLIGKKGKTITELERKTGLRINVEPLKNNFLSEKIPVNAKVTQQQVVIHFDKEYIGSSFDLSAEHNYICTGTVGKNATIKIKKDREIAQLLIHAINQGKQILAIQRDE